MTGDDDVDEIRRQIAESKRRIAENEEQQRLLLWQLRDVLVEGQRRIDAVPRPVEEPPDAPVDDFLRVVREFNRAQIAQLNVLLGESDADPAAVYRRLDEAMAGVSRHHAAHGDAIAMTEALGMDLADAYQVAKAVFADAVIDPTTDEPWLLP